MGGYIGAKVGKLVTTAANVSGDATIGGNLTVKGTTVTVDSATAQTVDLGDNDKIRLGDGDDLQLFHDGTHSYVDDTGTGRLYLRGNDRVQIQKYTGEDMITAIADDAVKLYHDNSNKLSTTSTGVSVTGSIEVDNGEGITSVGGLKYIADSDNNAPSTGVIHNFYTDNGTTSVFAIQKNGKIGVNTSSPLSTFQVRDSGAENGSLRVGGSGASLGLELLYDQSGATTSTIQANPTYTSTTSLMKIRVDGDGNPNQLVLDGAGNIMVGGTNGNPVGNHAPQVLMASYGHFQVHRDAGNPVRIGRSDSGNLTEYYKQGAQVGVVYESGNDFGIRSTQSGKTGLQFGTRVLPVRNNVIADDQVDMGHASFRFDDIYATNGSINTSDKNLKQDIEVLSDAEKRVGAAAKSLIKKFRWKDAVAEKGDDARIHVGIVAQELKAAFEAEGLDAGRYGMFISTTWWEANRVVPAVEANEEEGIEAVAEHTVTDTFDTKEEAPKGATERTRLGVRYSELLAFIIGAM